MSQLASGRWSGALPSVNTLRRWWPALALLAAFVVVSVFTIPRIHVDGSPRLTTYDLDASQPAPGLRDRRLTRNIYGFVVGGFDSGTASFTVGAPRARTGDKTVLVITAGHPDAPTRVTLIDGSGARHPLGTATAWSEHRVDVSRLVSTGRRPRIEFSATNSSSVPRLVADKLVVATFPSSAIPRAGRWEVAAWVALGALLVLALLRRVRRDFVLVPAAGLTALLVWPSVVSSALTPLPSDVWGPATHAAWFDLDHGLISGTLGPVSALGVQLFHALTPITGTGDVGARTASMLVGILTIVAIYALGRRVAAAVGGVAIVTLALLSDPFRHSLSSGDITGTWVLASCLFLLAVHRVLVRRDLVSLAILGTAGAVATLADATWWPGVVAALVFVALRYGPDGSRRLALAIALGMFALVAIPARVSVAHQSNGDLTADVTLRTTYARNAEFVGRGHSAPPDAAAFAAAPYSGQRVGLGSYVFGDHSLSVVAGGTLSGAYDAIATAGARPQTVVVGLLAFIVELAGVIYLLILPRLRLFVVIPAMLALVPWFLSDRVGNPVFQAVAPFWPAMLLGGATIAYAAWGLVEPRIRRSTLASTLGRRTAPLLARRRRAAQPS